jgi:tetratricopeptide (TPR) repeat protein
VALDPDFALAHGAMAEAYISLGNDGKVPPAKAFPLAKASAERALAIDPHCIQAITALGEYAFHYEWDYAQSERLLRQALEVDPNYAIVYSRLSGHLRMLNHADEAKVLELRESDLQPERPQVRQLNELKALVTAKQFNAAVATARQLASQMTDGYFGSYLLGDTLRQAGQWAEAVQQLEKAVDQYPDEIRLLEALGMTYAGMGQSDKARGVLVRMSAIQETRFVSPLSFAHVAGAMGDRDLAFSEIERAMHLRDPFLPSVGMDEGLAPIKGDPRYRDVLKRLKLDAYFPEVARQ